jgi:hypothetical protein
VNATPRVLRIRHELLFQKNNLCRARYSRTARSVSALQPSQLQKVGYVRRSTRFGTTDLHLALVRSGFSAEAKLGATNGDGLKSGGLKGDGLKSDGTLEVRSSLGCDARRDQLIPICL